LTQQEEQQAMDSLIYLVQKDDGRIIARACANSSIQRECINSESINLSEIETVNEVKKIENN
jgi:hypothetical protein